MRFGASRIWFAVLLSAGELSAGINAHQARAVDASKDPALAVRLEKSAGVHVVTVKRLLNPSPPLNGNPPRVSVQVEKTLRGKALEEDTVLIWLPFERDTPDWNCDTKCREDHMNAWARSPAPAPPAGERFLVCVVQKRKDLVVPAHCRFPATDANLKAVETALSQESK